MSSKIEQIIDEIEEYIDNCKPHNFSSSKIVVNRDEIDELLTELRMKTPEEIKRYQKILANKDYQQSGGDFSGCQSKGRGNYCSGTDQDGRISQRASDHAAGICTGK